MNVPSIYLLDTNVFIEAARRYYAFDIAPSFWETLIDYAQNGRVLSIDRVKTEIDRGNDTLQEWARNDFHQWFRSTNRSVVIEAYRQIMAWAHGQDQFSDAAKADFSKTDNADAWVVAYAKANGCLVVTHEQFDLNIMKKIPIPNVCRAFEVQYIDTFQMLRDLGVRLG